MISRIPPVGRGERHPIDDAWIYPAVPFSWRGGYASPRARMDPGGPMAKMKIVARRA